MINIMYNYKSKGLKNALDLRSNHSVYGKLQLEASGLKSLCLGVHLCLYC